MSNSELTAAVDAMSARLMAVEMLLFSLVEVTRDRAALRDAFDGHAAGIEATMNARPVADRQIELLRQSLHDMRCAIG
jgi:hypothetical protein